MTGKWENAVENFFEEILQEEVKIRESLAEPVPLEMKQEDWWKFTTAKECHVCNKSLIKDAFLDSMHIFDHNTGGYCGKSHKRCYYEALKTMGFVGPKMKMKETDVWDKWIGKKSGNMSVLRRAIDEEKLQRRGEGPLPHNGEVQRSSAQ